jgi:hypothetical protein
MATDKKHIREARKMGSHTAKEAVVAEYGARRDQLKILSAFGTIRFQGRRKRKRNPVLTVA